MSRWVLVAAALLVTAGCNVTPEGDPLRPRRFTPEPPPETQTRQSRDQREVELRLGWVRSAEHLGHRISWRVGSQIGHYERRRWAESPVVYLDRALRRRLFLAPEGVRRTVTGEPSLDVTLTSFEEGRDSHPDGDALAELPEAQVGLSYVLLRGDEHVAEGTIVAREPLEVAPDDERAGSVSPVEALNRRLVDDGPLLAAAFGRALERAVDELATTVSAQLGPGE